MFARMTLLCLLTPALAQASGKPGYWMKSNVLAKEIESFDTRPTPKELFPPPPDVVEVSQGVRKKIVKAGARALAADELAQVRRVGWSVKGQSLFGDEWIDLIAPTGSDVFAQMVSSMKVGETARFWVDGTRFMPGVPGAPNVAFVVELAGSVPRSKIVRAKGETSSVSKGPPLAAQPKDLLKVRRFVFRGDELLSASGYGKEPAVFMVEMLSGPEAEALKTMTVGEKRTIAMEAEPGNATAAVIELEVVDIVHVPTMPSRVPQH